ncbi:MAG TPA: tetratricopeptide repeat protein [Thermoanaerobaculia bacterium]|nr:tetratricopeptide repeat protein [Thermoanaerobaculia bacterium]
MRFQSKIVSAAVLALLFAGAGRAQDWRGRARVDGRVLNEKGEGVPGAKLVFRRAGAGPEAIASDKNGRWAYLGLAGGAWDIDVEADGYLPYRTTVQLSEIDRIPSMAIRLQPAPKAEPTPAAGVPKNAAPDVIPILEHGNQLIEQKDFAGARAEYEKALVSVPNNPIILRAIAQTYYGEKKVDQAIATLKKVVELDPNDSTALLLLANLQIEKGNLEEGKATLAKVPADAIKDPGVFTNIGILLLNKKKPEDAWTYFDQAVKLAPADADGYYYRGMAAYQAKKKAEAKADFQKYLELAPQGGNAADVKEYLKTLK